MTLAGKGRVPSCLLNLWRNGCVLGGTNMVQIFFCFHLAKINKGVNEIEVGGGLEVYSSMVKTNIIQVYDGEPFCLSHL